MFRTVTYLTIFIPTNAHNKKTVLPQIYDISRVGLNWPSLGTWLTKTRLVANYVTNVQLQLCYFWNKCCEQLPNLYWVNRKWKYWVVKAMYNTRSYKEHRGVMHVLIHPDSWSLFITKLLNSNPYLTEGTAWQFHRMWNYSYA